MDRCQDSTTDQALWNIALQDSFVRPPKHWRFDDGAVWFGDKAWGVSKATLYELALLDIHAQYWEVANPVHLRRYHRSLQCEVECCFQSSNTLEMRQTPPFLKSWLTRVMFQKNHDKKGRDAMSEILNEIPEKERYSLETGNLKADGTVSTAGPPLVLLLRIL
jgi:hypothetical protein